MRPSCLSFLALAVLLALAPSCGSSSKTPVPPSGDEGDGDPSATPPDGADGGPSAQPGQPAALAFSKNVRIIVEPSDKGAALLGAINGAKKSVHMTMYMLQADSFTQALVARKKAGVDVAVLLNQAFPQGGNVNQPAFDTLKAAGVAVVWAPAAYAYTHAKTVLIDGTDAWVMTMNLTDTSMTKNREYLAVDSEPADLAQAERIFQADFNNKAADTQGALVVSPTNAEARLLALANGAQTSVDVEAEVLSEFDFVNALAALADRGVKVRVVVSADNASSGGATAVTTLKQHKVAVVALSSPYQHAKAIVVDGARAYVGSVNFTNTSLSKNRELGVLTDTAAEVAKVASTINQDFAKGTAQ